VWLEEIQVTYESDVGEDFTIPSMDADISRSRIPDASSHDDEDMVQDAPP
jgi:hypothetical protein